MNLERFTEFNCDKFSWKVGKGDIILFPSSLVHSVSPNTQDQTRVSLSFNTFIKGSLGYETELNKLTIL
jgi:ectoine hydroxylase-related dioxygenase (phytanoyl-CoA dioxygenase family)